MSRIGQNPILIPEGVKVLLDGSKVKVSGSNGSLEFQFRNENCHLFTASGAFDRSRVMFFW